MDRALDRIAAALCCVWIATLLFTGLRESEVLVLHLFQSLSYVAVLAFLWRGSKWAYGIGIAVALLWDAFNLHASLAFFAHLLLLAVLAVRYSRRRDKLRMDAAGFGAAFVMTVGYFAFIFSVYGPQQLVGLR